MSRPPRETVSVAGGSGPGEGLAARADYERVTFDLAISGEDAADATFTQHEVEGLVFAPDLRAPPAAYRLTASSTPGAPPAAGKILFPLSSFNSTPIDSKNDMVSAGPNLEKTE